MSIELRWADSGMGPILQFRESDAGFDERGYVKEWWGEWTDVPTVTIHPPQSDSDGTFPTKMAETARALRELSEKQSAAQPHGE